MQHIFSIDIDVRDYELDSEGIVNNANYLHYLEHTRHAFCKMAGYSFAQMESDGIMPVMSRIEVDYKSPLHSGDTMTSCLWLEMKGARFVFHQEIYNKSTGKLAVKAIVSVVTLENGKLSRGDKLKAAFEQYLYTSNS